MIEHVFKSIVDVGNEFVWATPSAAPWLIVLLVGSGIFVTFRMGWIQVRQFGHAIQIIRGKYDNPKDAGDINHFQALTTALSATVGIGNIAGVATAIHYGGPGAIFWMWVTAVFGMTLKFVECTLSMHYRKFDDKGNASGGPMYYIEMGLGKNWKWMAMIFAFLAIVSSFGSGNMNQANTVAVSAFSEFLIPDYITGAVLAFLVGLVILGGITRIGAVTSKLMPFMAIIYIIGALTIIIMNIGELPAVINSIFANAFTPEAGFGGTTAGVFSLTLIWGVKRGLFSNEAGQGSAPIAHAAAKTKEPVREGIVAMIGPFIDTLVICSMTAFIILLTGVWDEKKVDSYAPFNTNKIKVLAVPEGVAVNDSNVHDGTLKAFVGTVSITEGKAAEFKFVSNDAFIENALIVTTDEEEMAYSGALTITPEGDVLGADGNPLDLRIKGGIVQNSSALTAFAFTKGLANITGHGSFFVTIAVFLFAVSTMISWSYYGDRCVVYLFGTQYILLYRVIYIGFSFLGAMLALETVWAYGDLALGLMTVPNLIACIFLSKKVVELTKDYLDRQKEGFTTYK